MLFFKHLQLYTWGVTSPSHLLVTFLVFDCTETGEDGRVWDAQGVFPVRFGGARWNHGEMLDVQIWAKLSEVTSCYLGVSSLGIGRVQTLERRFKPGWSGGIDVVETLDPGEKTRIPVFGIQWYV